MPLMSRRSLLQALAAQLLDATAAPADGVLMGLEPGVIQRGGAGLDPAHETELDEQLERRVDRRRARPWELLVDRAMDLLGGRVLAPAAELTEDHEPLGGDALAPRMEQLDQVVQIVWLGGFASY